MPDRVSDPRLYTTTGEVEVGAPKFKIILNYTALLRPARAT